MHRIRQGLAIWTGWVAGTTVTGMLTFPTATVVVDLTQQFLPMFLPATLLVGLGQWIILRSLLRVSGWWVVASAAGAFIVFPSFIAASGGLLAWGGPDAWQTFLLVSIATACVGMLVGAAQGGILGRHGYGATRWLLISAVAWGVGWPFGWLVGSTLHMRVDSTLAQMLLGGTIWAIVGAITGAGLVGLLNESRQVVFTQDPAPQERDQAEQCHSPE